MNIYKKLIFLIMFGLFRILNSSVHSTMHPFQQKRFNELTIATGKNIVALANKAKRESRPLTIEDFITELKENYFDLPSLHPEYIGMSDNEKDQLINWAQALLIDIKTKRMIAESEKKSDW